MSGEASSCHDSHCSHSAAEHQRAHESLFPLLDVPNVRALNAADVSLVRRVLVEHEQRFQTAVVARSETNDDDDDDDDDESVALIVRVPFTACVKLKSFTVAALTSDSSPRRVRLFLNRDDIDFGNWRDEPATEEFDLVSDASVQPDVEYAVKAARWQRVESVTMAFSRGVDAQLALTYVGFRGEFEQRIVRQAVIAVYESAAQLHDHAVPSAGERAREQM